MSPERLRLHRRWHDATGEDMPQEIAEMSLADIERRLKIVESKDTVGVMPSRRQESSCVFGDDSMMDHDGWKP